MRPPATSFDAVSTAGPATRKAKPARTVFNPDLPALFLLFTAWKFIVLLVVGASPGPGYDTSTQILLRQNSRPPESTFARGVDFVVLRLTRWDAIYFATASARGHLYEQEWAFSWFLSYLTSAIATVLFAPLPLSPILKHALAGVILSNFSHLLAVIALHSLVYHIVPSTLPRKRQFAWTAAVLHILSPAGAFLLASNSESAFALCNFTGMFSYARAAHSRCSSDRRAWSHEAFWSATAGIWFAIACAIRSNGLLSGVIFAWDAAAAAFSILHQRRVTSAALCQLGIAVCAGSLVALGYSAPQMVAYLEFCTGGNTRPWCSAIPPSIYSFVQSHYWNVGFLRYWTLSNLPLFLLALPTSYVMLASAGTALLKPQHITYTIHSLTVTNSKTAPDPTTTPPTSEEKVFQHLLPRFALPQLVLVLLTFTSFHCQIINRLSSGYPLWYLTLAVEMCVASSGSAATLPDSDQRRVLGKLARLPRLSPEWTVRAMVAYALVQGGLYASFLPPA